MMVPTNSGDASMNVLVAAPTNESICTLKRVAHPLRFPRHLKRVLAGMLPGCKILCHCQPRVSSHHFCLLLCHHQQRVSSHHSHLLRIPLQQE
jgi:hypothetical protein